MTEKGVHPWQGYKNEVFAKKGKPKYRDLYDGEKVEEADIKNHQIIAGYGIED